ncbi:MAG: heparinase II/III-family protein [Proteobacteria bacterium]|nr:heparinase II/III-family protein [Pseudomonadota bacterium]
MLRFTEAVTKPSGRVVMIGDNDSGRLLKLAPTYHAMTVAKARRRHASLAGYADLPDNETHWVEDHLDHRSLVAAASALFVTSAESRPYDHLEAVLIRALVGDRTLPTPASAPPRPLPHESPPAAATPLTRIEVVTGAGLRNGVAVTPFPDFGLYIYRSRRLFLAVRCGSIGQNGRGGHAHNDQLSIELAIDGEDWIVDPGTYLYTPLPAARNRYRSIAAHCAPRLGLGEPARLDRGVFWMPDDPHARCHRCGDDEFIGSHDGFGAIVVRRIIIADDRLIIEDRTDAPAAGPPASITCTGRDETRSRLQPQLPISPGYGVLLAS